MPFHKTVAHPWALASVFVLMSCGGATSEPQPERDVRTCTINYSVHPLHGGERMGDQRRAILRRELGDGFAASVLASDLRAFSASMIEELRRDLGLPPFTVEQVRGGYKGETSDSLTATTHYMGSANESAFTHLTSAVGYVFMQDGMVLQCSLPEQGMEKPVPALVLTDVGTRDDLNSEAVGTLYEEMVDVTGFGTLGFTYEPAEDTMTILVFSPDGQPERQAIAWAMDTLNAPDHPLEVAFSEDERIVSFPGHRWEDDAAGSSYIQLLDGALQEHTLSQKQLDRYQRTYLSIIDTYADDT